MATGQVPAIIWGGSFENTLIFGLPLDNVISWERPIEGSSMSVAPSGERDGWIVGLEHVLEGDVRGIPTSDLTSPYVATGWDGASGWRAFLTWAREGPKTFRFAPEKGSLGVFVPSYLVRPWDESPSIDSNGERRVRLEMVSADGSAYTGF